MEVGWGFEPQRDATNTSYCFSRAAPQTNRIPTIYSIVFTIG